MSAQQLELAVLYAYNPPGGGEEAAVVKAQATRFCEEVKGSQDGWRLALELFRATSHPEARFFSLGCLQDALGARAGAAVRVASQHDRFLIREAVMGWLTRGGGGGGAELDAQETFIRTKVAVVLALLIKSDYPEVWTDAFEQLRSVLVVGDGSGGGGGGSANGGATGGGRSAAAARAQVELYLRVLCALDEEVVTFHVDRTREEADHNSLIKDTMRISNVVVQICGVIYEVVGAFKTEAPNLAAFALETLRKYIGWIDIAQVVNERFLNMFLECLRSSDEQLVRWSCSCILEVVNKKVAHPVAKLRLLQQLKLAEMLKQVPLSDETVAVRVAELVDGVVKQLLAVWDKLEPAALSGGVGEGLGAELGLMAAAASSMSLPPASTQILSADANDAAALAATAVECADMLQEALPMLWACVSHPDVDVAFTCSDAIGALLQTLKRQLQAEKKGGVGGSSGGGGVANGAGQGDLAGRRFRAMDHLPHLLATLYQRMKYPPDFAFDPSDEDEGEEDMLRQQLRRHLVNAIRNAPEVALEFICRALSSLPTPLSALPFPDLEAALRLIFHFSEGCGGASGLNSSAGGGGGGRRPASPGAAGLLRSGAFPQMVLALHDSDVAQHKHPQVLMLYFQLTVRYSKMLADGPPHLVPKILEAICGPQGLSNPDITLRTRSCFFLTKLVKAMREGVVPYVDVIVTGVQALLDSPRGNGLDLSDEAKLNLYETIGFLVGMPDVQVSKQVQLLDGVLGPQMRRIAENLRAAAATTGERVDAAGTEVAAGVGAMANVSKGFKAGVAAEVEARFFQALEAATSALMAFPRHPAVRAKTMFLVHGLIPCLGEGLLRGFPLTALLTLVQEGDGKDLMEVTQVLNQLTIEFGPQSAQLLDGILLPFIRRTYQLTPGAGSTTAAAAAAAGTANGGGPQQASGEGPNPGVPFGGGWPSGAKSPAAEAPQQQQQQQQLLAHEVAERSGLQKLYFSVVQHISSNGLAGVLSSPTNGAHLDGVLRSVLGGLSGAEDAATKKTCLYIFSLLLGGFNRGRSGGVDGGGGGGKNAINGGGGATTAAAGGAAAPGRGANDTRAGAGAPQRRALSGKGGGVWTGSGPTVDMEPGVRAAVTAFVREEVVPAVLKCLVDGAPTGLDLRDATAMSAIVHMGALLKEAKEASGGAAGFVGAAALGCNCTPQVAEQLQRAVEGAADGPAIATALKAFAQHMRPGR